VGLCSSLRHRIRDITEHSESTDAIHRLLEEAQQLDWQGGHILLGDHGNDKRRGQQLVGDHLCVDGLHLGRSKLLLRERSKEDCSSIPRKKDHIQLRGYQRRGRSESDQFIYACDQGWESVVASLAKRPYASHDDKDCGNPQSEDSIHTDSFHEDRVRFLYHPTQPWHPVKPMMSEKTAPPADLFDHIRAACRSVADRADHVTIRAERIGAYAAELQTEDADLPPIDADRHFIGNPENTLAYFVTLSAINFGSGYFPYLAKRHGMSGYYTIASTLADRYRRLGSLSASQLRAMTSRDCAQMLGQDLHSFPIRELMSLFARSLNDLGKHLETRFEGRFESLVEAADRSAARLVDLLSVQPFFRDVPSYRGLAVPLYKRSQLLASDLALAFGGDGPGRFDDLDRLTIFADNLVPHVLRIDGLLDYSDTLAMAIDTEEPIRAGADEEIEIRACAVHCVELIRDVLTRTGRPATSRQLDQLFWHRGQQPRYKEKKRHRTRTVFY